MTENQNTILYQIINGNAVVLRELWLSPACLTYYIFAMLPKSIVFGSHSMECKMYTEENARKISIKCRTRSFFFSRFVFNLILCIMNDMYIVLQQIICIDSLYVCALRNWRAISSSIWFEWRVFSLKCMNIVLYLATVILISCTKSDCTNPMERRTKKECAKTIT